MGENRFQRPGPLRPTHDRAREPYPQPTAGEPTGQDAAPAGFDECEFPDEITLSRTAPAKPWAELLDALGLPICAHLPSGPVIINAAVDTWYAGVPRGDRLVLRRI